jgi:hypothetical protein
MDLQLCNKNQFILRIQYTCGFGSQLLKSLHRFAVALKNTGSLCNASTLCPLRMPTAEECLALHSFIKLLSASGL